MEPEIAVARHIAAAGGQLRARPAGDQRGGRHGSVPPGGRHCAAGHGICITSAGLAAGSGKGEAAPTEAGYPNGIDAGDFTPNPGFPTVADAIMNDLNKAGIRVQMRQMERATFYGNWIEKKLHGVVMI